MATNFVYYVDHDGISTRCTCGSRDDRIHRAIKLAGEGLKPSYRPIPEAPWQRVEATGQAIMRAARRAREQTALEPGTEPTEERRREFSRRFNRLAGF